MIVSSYKNTRYCHLLVVCFAALAFCALGCSGYRYPLSDESISSCDASNCHLATPLGQYPPVSGNHTIHLNSLSRIDCIDCHHNYGDHPLHKNGAVNGYNSISNSDASGVIVYFNGSSNPNGSWDNGSNSCNNMICHGNVNWHTTDQMGCDHCHAPGTVNDPLTINGSGDKGKHFCHVYNQSITCETCHCDYGICETHRNGFPDKDNPLATLISFESDPGASWNSSSNTCNSMSCHGNADWYTTVEQGCIFCHAPGTTYDPLTKGKHTRHVSDKNYSCETCHYNYTSLATHSDGTLQRGPVTSIVNFDPAAYPGASWIYSTCNNLWCHGAGTPDWLGTALTCRDCHVSGDATFDPEEINGSGSAGKHVTHVSQKGYQCESCHFSYRDAPTHNNGQWNKGSDVPAATLVSFDPAAYPGASWIYSTCSNLWCHGAGTPDWYDTIALTCRSCHVSGDGTFDPAQRDGALPGGGKHSSHLNTGHNDFSGNMHCEICHYTYRDAMTHNNGDWNDGDPSGTPVPLIAFDPAYAGSWVYSTCQSMICHGNADWFTADSMMCTNCHDNAYSVYHPVPDVQGEHSFHITTRGYACDTCHNGYTAIDTHHLNGVLDTPLYGIGSVNVIFFLDQASYKLNWEDNNIGNCSRTGTGPGCHGGWDIHPWYDPALP